MRSSRTIFALAESKFPVGSSANIKEGEFDIDLAIATLCFCPPEICDPLTPTLLSKPVLFYLSFCTNYWFVSYYPVINEIALAF